MGGERRKNIGSILYGRKNRDRTCLTARMASGCFARLHEYKSILEKRMVTCFTFCASCCKPVAQLTHDPHAGRPTVARRLLSFLSPPCRDAPALADKDRPSGQSRPEPAVRPGTFLPIDLVFLLDKSTTHAMPPARPALCGQMLTSGVCTSSQTTLGLAFCHRFIRVRHATPN